MYSLLFYFCLVKLSNALAIVTPAVSAVTLPISTKSAHITPAPSLQYPSLQERQGLGYPSYVCGIDFSNEVTVSCNNNYLSCSAGVVSDYAYQYCSDPGASEQYIYLAAYAIGDWSYPCPANALCCSNLEYPQPFTLLYTGSGYTATGFECACSTCATWGFFGANMDLVGMSTFGTTQYSSAPPLPSISPLSITHPQESSPPSSATYAASGSSSSSTSSSPSPSPSPKKDSGSGGLSRSDNIALGVGIPSAVGAIIAIVVTISKCTK